MSKEKVLVVASVASMIDQFNIPFIKLMIDMGYHVDVACNFEKGSTCTNEKIAQLKKTLKAMGVDCFQIDFARNVLNIRDNLKAFSQVEKLMKCNDYVFAHCHSPIGGMITRIAGKITKTKIIYTAHGFHFYKGAPLLNWMVYYPIELLCGYWTDILITINNEDYELAQKHIKAKEIVYVPGIGVDLNKFGNIDVDRNKVRESLCVPADKIWILSVGELIKRKNQERLIRAIAQIPNVYLTIAGRGELQPEFENLIKELKIEDRVKLLGFRTDISALCASADVFAFPSFQEGLSVTLMEAMAWGKPCVVSAIRGNTDLIDENGGVLFDPHNIEYITRAVNKIIDSNWQEMSIYNKKKIRQFDLPTVINNVQELYNEFLSREYLAVSQIIKRQNARRSLGLNNSDVLLLSIGELNNNKNHASVIRAINNLNVKYMIAGKGPLKYELINLIDSLGMREQVKLLGFRNDINDLLSAADIYVFPSHREGLSVALMEAMASGLPCAVSKIRGNIDLIDHNGGRLFNPQNVNDIKSAIVDMLSIDRFSMQEYNKLKIQRYSLNNIIKQVADIYRSINN